MLIDDQTVVVGSLALAALSLDFRREVAIVVTEPAAVAEAVELFRTVRDAATEGRRGHRRLHGRGAMLIAVCLAALVIASTPRLGAAPVPCVRAVGRTAAQEPQAPAEKKAKKDKKPKKPKKKKAKKNKVAADEEPSPDEPIDPQAERRAAG